MRERKGFDTNLWKQPLHRRKIQKQKATTTRKRLRVDLKRSDKKEQLPNWCGYTGLRDSNVPTSRKSRVIKGHKRKKN